MPADECPCHIHATRPNNDSLGHHATAKILHIFLKVSVCKARHATLQLIAVNLQ